MLVWPELKDELVAELRNAITEFYGDDRKQSPDYGRVINSKNFDRLAKFLDNGTVAASGDSDADERYIAPAVLVDVSVDAPIMQEEVFGSILPVLEIDSVEAVIDWVNERPRPLGLYVFSEDDEVVERILESTNRATRASTTALSIRSFPSSRSAASATPAWASTTAAGDSRGGLRAHISLWPNRNRRPGAAPSRADQVGTSAEI